MGSLSLIELKLIDFKNKRFLGLKINLGKAPLLIIKGEKGYVMCGYLNINVAEKLGDIAVMVTGVNNLDEMINKEIKAVTSKAKELGINIGLKVSDILDKL